MMNILLSKTDERFIYHLNKVRFLSIVINILGFSGFAVALYAIHLQIPVKKFYSFILTPMLFVLFNGTVLVATNIIRKLQLNPDIDLIISDIEREIVKNIKFLYLAASVVLLLGMISAGVGIYGLIFRQVSLFGRVSTSVLILLSTGYIAYGLIIRKTCKILKKYNDRR